MIRPVAGEIPALQQNLFAGSSDLLRNLPEHEKGPRADGNGKIINYTLVGSVQGFIKETEMRQQKQQQAIQKNRVKMTLQPSEMAATNMSHTNSYNRQTEHASSTTLGKSQKKKAKDYQDIILNEDELGEHIQDMEKRMEGQKNETRKKNARLKRNLKNKGDSLKVDQFERVLDNFNSTQEKWDSKKKTVSLVIKSPGKTMDDRIDQYRAREEMRQLLDNLTPPEVKFGENFWKQGLRQPQSSLQMKYPYKYMDEQELDPKKYIIEQKPPVLETIRKPQSTQNQFRPFTSFSTRKYLDKKLDENKNLIDKLICTQPDQLEHLKIVGQNVLQREIDSLQHRQDFKSLIRVNSVDFNKYVKRIPIKQELIQKDETIIKDYRLTMIQRGQDSQLLGFF